MPKRKVFLYYKVHIVLITKLFILEIKITGRKAYARKNDRAVYGNGQD